MNIKLQLQQHWWKWYNYAISLKSTNQNRCSFMTPLDPVKTSWKCEFYQMRCLSLVYSVISRLRPVNTCVSVIWLLLKKTKSSYLNQFHTQFLRDKPLILNLSMKTGYNGQSERNSLVHSKSQLRLNFVFSNPLIAPLLFQNSTNLLFPRIRASKYLHTEVS